MVRPSGRDLERSSRFYSAVLEHTGGNPSAAGILVYMNVDGRIVEQTKSIGPHGFRAVIVDSEGNRVALHSNTDK
jgi:predicted enzyme related to lactoylglutathione lyase